MCKITSDNNVNRRKYKDIIVYSNICFVINGIISYYNGVYDLAFFLAICTLVSLAYHTNKEKKYICIDETAAKFLFVYGFMQTITMKDPIYLIIEIMSILLLLITYFVVGIAKLYPYYPWHSLQHITGFFWTLPMALYHECLLC